VNPRPPSAANSPGGGSSFTRLYNGAQKRAEKLKEKETAAAATLLQECTFHPLLNLPVPFLQASPAAAADPPESSSSSSSLAPSSTRNAFSRLYHDAQERKAKAEAVAAAVENAPIPSECTFEPALSLASRRIGLRMGGRGSSSPEQGFTGGESVAGRPGWSPGLADVSSAATAATSTANASPRHVLLYEEGVRKQRERREQAELVEQLGGLIRLEDALECTFKPRVSPRPSGLGESDRSPESPFTYSRTPPDNGSPAMDEVGWVSRVEGGLRDSSPEKKLVL